MGARKNISIISVVIVLLVGVTALLYFTGVFSPTELHSENFKTEIVSRGSVVSGVAASGIVESENEVQLLCPATSLVKLVHKEPGSWVEKGELILELNEQNIENEIENIGDQLEVKRNSLEKNRLNAQSTRLDLEYNEEVKKLRITSLKSTLADQEQLLEVGGISPAKLEKTKQEIELAEKDLKTLSEKNSIKLKQLEADEKGLLLGIKMQKKTLEEKQVLLERMRIVAPSAGIILAIDKHAGEEIEKDKMIVRMSDLSSFKITGSVDEKLAKQIKTGNRVYVSIDNERLEGRVGIITPVVENNKVQFNVHLKEKSHPKLIANQNVDIQVVGSRRDNVLNVKKHPVFEESGKKIIYVVENDVAIKREITIGVVGSDSCEIVSGLQEGDEVVVEGFHAGRK